MRVPPFSQSAPTTCLFASRSDRRRLRLRLPTADLDSKPPSRRRAVSSARSPLAIGATLLLPTDPIASDFYVCLTRTRTLRNMGLVRKSQVSRPLPLPLFLCVSHVRAVAASENCWRRQPGVAELPPSAVCRCDHANQTQALTKTRDPDAVEPAEGLPLLFPDSASPISPHHGYNTLPQYE